MNNLDAINELTLIFYAFFSWVYVASSIFIMKQTKVNIKRRINTAGAHFLLGTAFAFAAARVATGGAQLYMYLVLCACFGFTYFAINQGIAIYKLNKAIKENRDEEQYQCKTILKTDGRNLVIGVVIILIIFFFNK